MRGNRLIIIMQRVVCLWNEFCNIRMVCMSNNMYYGGNIIYLIRFGFFVCDWIFYIPNKSCRKCCNIICRVLYNCRTSVWFIICEIFNKVECCTKFSGEVKMWNCREELILWCSREMDVVVMFYRIMCNLGRVRSQTYLFQN